MCARKRISNGIFSYYDQIDGFVYCPPFFLQWQKLFYDFSGFFEERNANKRKDDDQVAHSRVVNGFQTVAKTIFIFVNILQEKKETAFMPSSFFAFLDSFLDKATIFLVNDDER